MAIAGHVLALAFRGRYRESSPLASELVGLIESIGDPTLTVALMCPAIVPKLMTGETGEGHCQLEQSEGDFRRFASAIHQVAC